MTTNVAWVRRLVVIGSVGALVALGAWPSAGVAATNLGETSTTGTNCLAGVTPYSHVQQATGSGASYTAPTDGVITSWSHEAQAGAGQMLKLKIYRATANPDEFTVVGQSTAESLDESALNTFDTQISVKAGDLLGMTRTAAVNVRCLFGTLDAGDIARDDPGADDANGVTSLFFSGKFVETRVNVAAVLEPDADGDGLGDETQDADDDNDGTNDTTDNCLGLANADQADADGD
ncbi:MAG: hypothetical protein ACR2N5_01910, partial [Solirubrobacterales bacterium]